ncbi:hypothetical protein [Azospirillum sp. sgz301742]
MVGKELALFDLDPECGHGGRIAVRLEGGACRKAALDGSWLGLGARGINRG